MRVGHIREPQSLTDQEIESVEKTSLRCLFQAAVDFGFDAFDIFYQSPDEVQDVAEDISREMMDRLGGYQIGTRILGNVDYRKARYVVLPELQIRQALFVESKAEKSQTTATLQMSETSMAIYQIRSGVEHRIQGQLPAVQTYRAVPYLSTTLLAHFHYEDQGNVHILKSLLIAAVPNGRLQDIYNPSIEDTIWSAGRNALSRDESFRVRLSFAKLEGKAPWRVQQITYDAGSRQIDFSWRD